MLIVQTKTAEPVVSNGTVNNVEVKPAAYNRALDKLGVWVSALCAIHCIVVPLMLPIAPLVASSFFAQSWFEGSVLTLSLVIGFTALLIGFKNHHRQIYPMYSLAIGAIIYINKDIFGHDYEAYTVAVGASFIIAAHLINLKLCRKCESC